VGLAHGTSLVQGLVPASLEKKKAPHLLNRYKLRPASNWRGYRPYHGHKPITSCLFVLKQASTKLMEEVMEK
jgi:hypothetical protein